MNLPDGFVKTVRATYSDGAGWLERLPALLDEYAARWELRLEPAFPNLSFNYVAPGVRKDGTPIVFKAGPPNAELSSEMAALALWDGRGAARELESDPERGTLLLERIFPGTPLKAWMTDDEEATRIVAAQMRGLWSPLPASHPFPDLARWTRELSDLRPHFGGGTGPFPERLVARAESLRAMLLADPEPTVLLHGDLHHDNVLRDGGGWRVIDPKGVAGERAFEAAAFLQNPDIGHRPDLERLLERRIELLADALALPAERLLQWGVAQSVLSTWWSFDPGTPFDPASLAVAEALERLLYSVTS